MRCIDDDVLIFSKNWHVQGRRKNMEDAHTAEYIDGGGMSGSAFFAVYVLYHLSVAAITFQALVLLAPFHNLQFWPVVLRAGMMGTADLVLLGSAHRSFGK